jgi:signal transduction histidine kinase
LNTLAFPKELNERNDSIKAFYNYPLKLVLPPKFNHLSFHFSALDWAASHKLQYQYILEGYDEDWSPLKPDGVAVYRNVPYGEYEFKFRAIGESKIWSDTISYSVNVLTPWTDTIFAKLLLAISIILMLLALYRWRTNRLKYNQKILKKTVGERTLELRTKTDELKKTNIELKSKNSEISNQSNELNLVNEALNVVNANLEKMVEARTNELMVKNKTLSDYAFINAHDLRVPVANIKGIIQLFEFNLTMQEKEELLEKLKGQSNDLDDVLIDIQRRLEKDDVLKNTNPF